MRLAIKRMRFALISVLLLCAMARHTGAAIITVTNTNDSGPGSLRQALANANNGDRINFAVSGAITLTSGALVVARNVTISGPGANQLSIDGNQGSYVFYVDAIVTIATISGLSIGNGGIGNFGTLTVSNCVISASGIFNGGALTVSNCDISGSLGDGIGNHAFSSGKASLTLVNSNVSGNDGIGISNYVDEFATLTVTMRSTTVSGNSAGGVLAQGGGVIFGGSIQVTITDCTVSGNTYWGGIHATGLTNLFVTDSTISGNSANTGFPGGDSGGGIYYPDRVENCTISGNSAATSGGGIYGGFTEIVNSTISGNSAGTSGGGIYEIGASNQVSLDVRNSTITGNSAPSGGGIYNRVYAINSVVEISNTILNAGASGENIFNYGGTITSLGYNLSSDDGGGYLTGPGDQINTDPLLGPLQNNGGSTFTHALLPGSPAIDAGDPNFHPPPFNDQRGCHFDRVFNGRIDIGSFETQPPRRPCSTPRPRPTPLPRP